MSILRISAKMTHKNHPKPGLVRTALISFSAVPPLERGIVLFGLTVAGIFELFGFATLIPLFAVMTPDSGMDIGGKRAVINDTLGDAFAVIGAPMGPMTLLGIIFLFLVIKAVVSIMVSRYVAGVMTRINTDARLEVVRVLMEARWSFYTRQRLSRLVSAAGENSNAVGEAFQLAADLFAALLRIIIYLTVCYIIAPPMVLIAAGVAMLMAVSYGHLVRRSKRAAKNLSRAMSQMKADLTDIFISIKSIRAMGRQAHMATLLSNDSAELDERMRDRVLSAEYAEELQAPIIAMLLVVGLMTGVSVLHLESHALLIGAVLLVRMIATFGFVQRAHQRLSTAHVWLASATRLAKEAAASQEILVGTEVPDPALGIVFDTVSFRHIDGREVLTAVDLRFEAGKITTLVGPSGSGKTTTLDLLLGLLPPRSGRLLLGGVDSDRVDLMKWRQRIGYVPQDVTLFNDNIRNNVALGESGFSDEDVWRALRAAGADVFVECLPEGLGHLVGDRGQMISGGQRQRIALARALLHRPAILVLDEATTGLDRESEEAICTRIREMVEQDGLTVIAVSHGEMWRQMADYIYRMADGRVVPDSRGAQGEVVPISKPSPTPTA